MLNPRLKTILLAAPLLALAGCGGGPALYPVGGAVTRNGEPLADAVVIFAPADASTVGAQGVTGPDGKYTLSSGDRSGAPAGKYTVSVTKAPASRADLPEAFKDDPSMADMAPDVGRKKKKPTNDDAVDATFEAEVVAGSNAPIDFDVKAAGEAAAKP